VTYSRDLFHWLFLPYNRRTHKQRATCRLRRTGQPPACVSKLLPANASVESRRSGKWHGHGRSLFWRIFVRFFINVSRNVPREFLPGRELRKNWTGNGQLRRAVIEIYRQTVRFVDLNQFRMPRDWPFFFDTLTKTVSLWRALPR